MDLLLLNNFFHRRALSTWFLERKVFCSSTGFFFKIFAAAMQSIPRTDAAPAQTSPPLNPAKKLVKTDYRSLFAVIFQRFSRTGTSFYIVSYSFICAEIGL